MIARLSGILIEKSVAQCVLDVQGVGYLLSVPLSTFYELPESGQPVVIHVHTHVREDALQLYGFHTPQERDVFQMMLAVSGIGPKLAVNILSGIVASELLRAIIDGDLRRLTGIPGVGKKTAERMILELKDRAGKIRLPEAPVTAFPTSGAEQVKEDALSALVNLGYKGTAAKELVERILRDAPSPLSLDKLLKQALRHLAG